jgi:hypothetical protein
MRLSFCGDSLTGRERERRGSARTNNAGRMALKGEKARSELRAAAPRMGIIETSTSTSKRRAREES